MVKGDRSWILGVIGGFVLFGYGIIPTFHRIYAAYGGIFIVMALVWGWLFEKIVPDFPDIIGSTIAIIGVVVILYLPRKMGGEKSIWANPK